MTESFETIFKKAFQGLTSRGIEVVIIDDSKEKFYGDLDGASVYIGESLSWEIKLFTMIHLAAHNYQWARSGRYAEIGSQLFYKPDEELIQELLAYEEEAASLAISLLHELGIYHLDKWFTQHSRCDLAYLDHYYHTGEEKQLKDFWKEDVEPFTEISLPSVQNFRRRVKVQKGVVVY
ncbi:MAG TPA: hypothetical protein VG676_16340 [Chitinophagaceae bacterium]|jgi:hypothetical protein|nr:hypothetical protein [Chitinophagaceae bacterium]